MQYPFCHYEPKLQWYMTWMHFGIGDHERGQYHSWLFAAALKPVAVMCITIMQFQYFEFGICISVLFFCIWIHLGNRCCHERLHVELNLHFFPFTVLITEHTGLYTYVWLKTLFSTRRSSYPEGRIKLQKVSFIWIGLFAHYSQCQFNKLRSHGQCRLSRQQMREPQPKQPLLTLQPT